MLVRSIDEADAAVYLVEFFPFIAPQQGMGRRGYHLLVRKNMAPRGKRWQTDRKARPMERADAGHFALTLG
jgi:hypothetical protein